MATPGTYSIFLTIEVDSDLSDVETETIELKVVIKEVDTSLDSDDSNDEVSEAVEENNDEVNVIVDE